VNQLRDNLKALGLSPNHIFQQVKDAIGEDLVGGKDITSVATIADTHVITADFTARTNGVVCGLHVVAAVLEYCGVNHYEVLVDEGAKVSVVTAAVASTNAAPSRMQVVLDFAKAQVGKPYEFAKAGPTSYDCSGLTKAAFAQVKVSLPHQSLLQSKLGTAVDWKSVGIQAGDLVFTYSTKNTTQISHVGIAISATQWIEAPYTGGSVRISTLPSASKIQAVRRVL
jgi:cell wall-associated NlpC family hydrolase